MINERDQQIIDLYLNHPELSNQDIANKFKISTGTVSRIARINNLPRRTGNSGTRLSIEEEKNIVQQYLNSVPLLTLQHVYNISYDRLKNLIKRYTDETISTSKRLNPQLIENYFEIIDSKEKAYWLGWLISDGAITNQPEKSKFQIEITIKQEDEDILHLFEKDLQVQNKVYPSQEIYRRFSLGCKKMVEDLNKLGITQNKSFTVHIPTIDQELQSHLLRGIFDGDGGFTVYTRSTGQINRELSFCGNEYVIQEVYNILLKNIPNLTNKKIENENNIKRVRWGAKKDINLIANYLYNNCGNHYLKRKRNLIYANTEVTSSITKGEEAPQSVEGEQI